MEEQHIAWAELGGSLGRDQFRVLGQFGTEEQIVIEPVPIERHAVRAGDQMQAAVVQGFGFQSQPDADKLGAGIRSIANILMPARVAAELRVLGHDAVVMGQRHHNLRAE